MAVEYDILNLSKKKMKSVYTLYTYLHKYFCILVYCIYKVNVHDIVHVNYS